MFLLSPQGFSLLDHFPAFLSLLLSIQNSYFSILSIHQNVLTNMHMFTYHKMMYIDTNSIFNNE